MKPDYRMLIFLVPFDEDYKTSKNTIGVEMACFEPDFNDLESFWIRQMKIGLKAILDQKADKENGNHSNA